jgi:hypothetical protein
MRLIQQQPLQTVHSHAVIEPSRDRVDVHDRQVGPRLMVLHDRAHHVSAFVTVAEKSARDRQRTCGWRRSRHAHETIKKGDEREAEHQTIEQDDSFRRDSPRAQVAVQSAGKEVRHPVIIQRLMRQKWIRRRHVALRELGSDGHRPHEIRREVRAIRLTFRNQFSHVRVRCPRHQWDDQQQHENGHPVALIECRKTE